MNMQQPSNSKTTEEKSVCGACRAMGVPVCKGHAGGGGAGEENSTEKQDSLTPAHELKPQQSNANALTSILEKNADWRSHDDFVFSLDGFNQNASLASIKLDLSKCALKLEPKKNLDSDQKENLKLLFDKIKAEVKQTDDAEITVNNGTVEIKLLNTEKFDALVSNLMNKNLLPLNRVDMQANLDGQSTTEARQKDQSLNNNSAPNPFDISKGPKPFEND